MGAKLLCLPSCIRAVCVVNDGFHITFSWCLSAVRIAQGESVSVRRCVIMSRNKGRSSFHLKVYLKLVSGFNLDTCGIHFPLRVQTLLESELSTNVYFCMRHRNGNLHTLTARLATGNCTSLTEKSESHSSVRGLNSRYLQSQTSISAATRQPNRGQ